MPDTLNNPRAMSVYVNHICWVTAEDHLYTTDTLDVEDYYYLSPHIYMEENYYDRSTVRTRSLRSDDQRVTAGDLALVVMESLASGTSERWDLLILAQTYPERYAMNPPLARILESTSWKVDYPLALSHMGPLAATEGMQAAAWTLGREERGMFVLAEQRVIEEHDSPGDLSDMAVALELNRQSGALAVNYIGKRTVDDIEGSVMASEIISIIDEFMDAGQTENILLQSRLRRHIIPYSKPDMSLIKSVYHVPETIDYQSGDVWIQLAEQLQSGNIKVDDRVLLISWDGERLLSACCVHVVHMPVLSRLTLHQEVKTS
ncbi:hypothetical protein [Paenibacillus sp. FSL R7-0026]|uniref:hypothetical protein n=1 Tax=Paenibacillus sp. FSL R7-0026 TaxID=2921668 RepID=UPI0030F5BD55